MSSNIDIKRICARCKQKFITHKTTTTCCSHRCANLLYKQRKREAAVKANNQVVEKIITEKPIEKIKDKPILTITEAAVYLGVTRPTLYGYLRRGELKASRLGYKLLLRKEDIDTLFDNPGEFRVPTRDKPAITDFYTIAVHHPNSYISRNSAAGYYSTFRALLKIAYKEKMLLENLNDFLEKIEWEEVKKEYLTLDEVKQLAATPCCIPVLKKASLFACMTGLRISDILKLRWSDFEMEPDQGYYIRICTEKTETEATLPISHEALELCGEWGKGLVFKGLTRAMTHHALKQWIAEAGIKKKITFHTARHSYAVIQISLGTDIYTVSKMLTHKNVTTTQIYADLVNSKKRETANKISLK